MKLMKLFLLSLVVYVSGSTNFDDLLEDELGNFSNNSEDSFVEESSVGVVDFESFLVEAALQRRAAGKGIVNYVDFESKTVDAVKFRAHMRKWGSQINAYMFHAHDTPENHDFLSEHGDKYKDAVLFPDGHPLENMSLNDEENVALLQIRHAIKTGEIHSDLETTLFLGVGWTGQDLCCLIRSIISCLCGILITVLCGALPAIGFAALWIFGEIGFPTVCFINLISCAPGTGLGLPSFTEIGQCMLDNVCGGVIGWISSFFGDWCCKGESGVVTMLTRRDYAAGELRKGRLTITDSRLLPEGGLEVAQGASSINSKDYHYAFGVQHKNPSVKDVSPGVDFWGTATDVSDNNFEYFASSNGKRPMPEPGQTGGACTGGGESRTCIGPCYDDVLASATGHCDAPAGPCCGCKRRSGYCYTCRNGGGGGGGSFYGALEAELGIGTGTGGSGGCESACENEGRSKGISLCHCKNKEKISVCKGGSDGKCKTSDVSLPACTIKYSKKMFCSYGPDPCPNFINRYENMFRDPVFGFDWSDECVLAKFKGKDTSELCDCPFGADCTGDWADTQCCEFIPPVVLQSGSACYDFAGPTGGAHPEGCRTEILSNGQENICAMDITDSGAAQNVCWMCLDEKYCLETPWTWYGAHRDPKCLRNQWGNLICVGKPWPCYGKGGTGPPPGMSEEMGALQTGLGLQALKREGLKNLRNNDWLVDHHEAGTFTTDHLQFATHKQKNKWKFHQNEKAYLKGREGISLEVGAPKSKISSVVKCFSSTCSGGFFKGMNASLPDGELRTLEDYEALNAIKMIAQWVFDCLYCICITWYRGYQRKGSLYKGNWFEKFMENTGDGKEWVPLHQRKKGDKSTKLRKWGSKFGIFMCILQVLFALVNPCGEPGQGALETETGVHKVHTSLFQAYTIDPDHHTGAKHVVHLEQTKANLWHMDWYI